MCIRDRYCIALLFVYFTLMPFVFCCKFCISPCVIFSLRAKMLINLNNTFLSARFIVLHLTTSNKWRRVTVISTEDTLLEKHASRWVLRHWPWFEGEVTSTWLQVADFSHHELVSSPTTINTDITTPMPSIRHASVSGLTSYSLDTKWQNG